MAKTLRTRTRDGWTTVSRRLTSSEVDDNFLALEDQFAVSSVTYSLSDADIASRPPRLWPVDSVPYRLFCASGDFAYGHATDNRQVVVVNIYTRSVTNGYQFPAGWAISDIYAGFNCVLVMAVETANNTYSLWRTTDGVNVTRVHDIGRDPNGDLTHRPFVRLLTRGIDRGKLNGKDALVLATYNVATDNAVANPGEIGDAIYIAKSLDDGLTWQRVNTWNWDFDAGTGSRTIKHFHAVRYDKWRDIWWICAGDATIGESSLIRWDGVSAGPGNVLPSSLGNYAGWDARSGSQRWRAVDVLVTEDWIETFTDSVGDVTGGIWRCRHDFTKSHRVDHTNRGMQHDGWSSLLHSGGTHLWCDDARADTNNNNQRYIGIYGSSNGNRYFEIGRIALTGTGVKIPRGFFEDDAGHVWFSCDGEAGKGAYNTTVFSLSGKFREERPDNIGPCYYVDFVNGNDSNDGYGVATAWKTARNAFGSNRMTHGARLVLSEGTSTENGVSTIDYAANAAAATDTTRHIQVSGQGRDNTTVIISGAIEGWKDSTTSKTWDIELADLTIKQANTTKAIIWDNSTASGGTPNWTFRDATIGDSTTGSSRAVYLRTSTAKSIRSKIINTVSTKYTLYLDGSAAFTGESSVLVGGRAIQRTGSKTTLKHCEIREYTNTGFTIDSTATLAPEIAYCIFGDGSDQTPIVNSSVTVTLTDADVYGCAYVKPAGVGVPDPILPVSGVLDRDNDTLIPFSWSALAGIANTPALLSWDYNGNPYRKVPTIGAFEIDLGN